MQFARHETFHLRDGWLFKGMQAIQLAEQDDVLATIFLDRDAPERLGIGRNMVNALRFWMQATGIASEQIEDRRSVQRLTSFGELIWQHDPYLDDDGTIWLIHYRIVSSRDHATTWYWFFNHFISGSFSDQDIVEGLGYWTTSVLPERKVAVSSRKKDVSCLLRTYLPGKRSSSPENRTECPLTRLQILADVSDSSQKRFYWQRPDLERLDPLIVLYVMLDRQEQSVRDGLQVGLSQVFQEPMNAGRVFNITISELTQLMERLNREHPDLQVSVVRTGSLDQLTLPRISSDEVLARYYTEELMLESV